jgi:hypothetical protein
LNGSAPGGRVEYYQERRLGVQEILESRQSPILNVADSRVAVYL